MQKMLFISNVFPLDGNPSRGCYVLAQAKILREAGYEVKVINPLPFLPPFYSLYDRNFKGVKKVNKMRIIEKIDVFHPRYFCFPGTLFPQISQKNAKSTLKEIYKWLGGWEPDIVHLHSIHPLLNIGKKVSEKYNSKLFMTVHGWDFDIGIKNEKISQSIEEIQTEISGICVVNKIHAKIAKKIIGTDKTHHIPCHIDIEEKYRRSVVDFDPSLKKLKILFPANPSRKEKNYPLFLMTVERLKESGWDIEIDSLKNISRNKTIQKFQWADLILLTSKREGGPLVTKEAIFCGTRVVCTSVGDSTEWLPSNSISKEATPESLAKSVEHALSILPEIWKISHTFEKENVLKRLIKMYQTN